MQDVGVDHAVCGHFGAGVAGTHHDESGPLQTFHRVVGGVGEFDLPGEVVPQVQRLRNAPEAVRVLGHARHRQ